MGHGRVWVVVSLTAGKFTFKLPTVPGQDREKFLEGRGRLMA